MWLYCGTEDTTRVRSTTPHWRGGWPQSRGIRTTLEGPGGSHHSTVPTHRTQYGHLFAIAILLYSFCFAVNWSSDLCFALLPDRPPRSYTRCPMERRRRLKRRKEVGAEARRSGIRMLTTTMRLMTLMRRTNKRRRRRSHHRARKGGRSLSMIPRLSVVRGSRPLPSRPSALGLLLRRRLRRLRSNLEWHRRNL